MLARGRWANVIPEFARFRAGPATHRDTPYAIPPSANVPEDDMLLVYAVQSALVNHGTYAVTSRTLYLSCEPVVRDRALTDS